MLLPSFEWSSLQIHESDQIFKDLTDIQVILIKKEYKEIKVGRISFWAVPCTFEFFVLYSTPGMT